jgi:hypothetical protein
LISVQYGTSSVIYGPFKVSIVVRIEIAQDTVLLC